MHEILDSGSEPLEEVGKTLYEEDEFGAEPLQHPVAELGLNLSETVESCCKVISAQKNGSVPSAGSEERSSGTGTGFGPDTAGTSAVLSYLWSSDSC